MDEDQIENDGFVRFSKIDNARVNLATEFEEYAEWLDKRAMNMLEPVEAIKKKMAEGDKVYLSKHWLFRFFVDRHEFCLDYAKDVFAKFGLSSWCYSSGPFVERAQRLATKADEARLISKHLRYGNEVTLNVKLLQQLRNFKG